MPNKKIFYGIPFALILNVSRCRVSTYEKRGSPASRNSLRSKALRQPIEGMHKRTLSRMARYAD